MHDRQQPIWSETLTPRLVELLSYAGSANLLIFAAVVLFGAMPIALLNPYWELRVAALLVENGGYALMGVILIHMAAWLAPEDLGLSARCRQIRGLAVAVTIGYLLLIPLQPVATLTSLANQASIQAARESTVNNQS